METAIIYDQVFDAQQHYRLILDSMARPGKINIIPGLAIDQPAAINNASALIAFALLNTDASFYAEDAAVTEFIALHTSAAVAGLPAADLLFVSGSSPAEFIALLKAGTLPYPENSATIIADVTQISEGTIESTIALTLQGPGVKDTVTVYVLGLNKAILDELKEQNQEFPLGIDLILTDVDNKIICIPRSNNFSYSLI